GRKELRVEESSGVRAIIRPAMLRHHAFHFRKAADNCAHLVGVFVSLFQSDGSRQLRTDPKIAFFELWQELQTEELEGRKGKTEQYGAANQSPGSSAQGEY